MITGRYSKTNNPEDDVRKFKLNRSGGGAIKKETIDLQISQVEKIHNDFPYVRFYDFHKQGKKYAINHFGCDEDYERCRRLPDGYYFSYPDAEIHPGLPWGPAIFIIEIENYSRVDEERVQDYIDWWYFFDSIEYTSFHIMEFNRFGNFQRDILKETFDERDSVDIIRYHGKREKI